MREKLIKLIAEKQDCGLTHNGNGRDFVTYNEEIADHLIANGVTVTDNHGKWISVKERLPQSGKCVLVYSKSGGVAEGCYSAYDKKWVQFRWSVKDLEVTHWMPLPEPPKGE